MGFRHSLCEGAHNQQASTDRTLDTGTNLGFNLLIRSNSTSSHGLGQEQTSVTAKMSAMISSSIHLHEIRLSCIFLEEIAEVDVVRKSLVGQLEVRQDARFDPKRIATSRRRRIQRAN